MTLEQQIAQAQALIANGKRIEELGAKRTQLTADLAKVNEELAAILGPPTTTPTSTRATQKCSKCGQEGHTKRTCTNPPKE